MSARLAHRVVIVVAAVALGGPTLAGCGGSDDATSSTTEAPAASEPQSTPAPSVDPTTTETTETTETEPTTVDPTTTEPVATEPPATTEAPTTTEAPDDRLTAVNVYWGSTVVNPAAGAPERIGAGGRMVTATTPVRGALDALFAGLDPVEESIGMVTSIPDGTRVLGIAVDGSTATVDLSAEFTEPSGTLDEAMRLAQVVFTVTQFDGIERVRFHVDGVAQDPVLSHGFEVGDGLTRDSLAEVRPLILVERPTPGAEVGDPIVITGESNTFEATVRYAVTGSGGDGVALIEGFTTATAGMGTWGTFEIVVPLADLDAAYEAGPGAVIVWEDSPRDGSRTDIVEIPIVLPPR